MIKACFRIISSIGMSARITGVVLGVAAHGYSHAHAYKFFDWAIACDNTRRCKAAGFQAEDEGIGKPVAMLLARGAGAATPVEMILLADTGDGGGVSGFVDVKVGAAIFEQVPIDGGTQVSQAVLKSMLPHLLREQYATLSQGSNTWELSLKGLNAVLLKMDEAQGRLGTIGALIRKGNKPESSVLPALPPPEIKVAKLPRNLPTDEALIKPILRTARAGDPDCIEEKNGWQHQELRDSEIWRLSATQVLVRGECGRGAYQSGHGFWIASIKPPHKPRRVVLPYVGYESPGVDGKIRTIDYVMNADFSDGILFSYEALHGFPTVDKRVSDGADDARL